MSRDGETHAQLVMGICCNGCGTTYVATVDADTPRWDTPQWTDWTRTEARAAGWAGGDRDGWRCPQCRERQGLASPGVEPPASAAATRGGAGTGGAADDSPPWSPAAPPPPEGRT